MLTIEDFIKLVTANAKTNKWLSGYYDVKINGEVFNVGIKSFNLWCQIVQIGQFKTDVSECKTQKAFKHNLETVLIGLAKAHKGANK